MVLGEGRSRSSLEARALEGGELTPVMARLGPTDLETLDALITAGIAASRAEAVRWALARIRERPAYAQLRERAREIERLKTEF
jgi:Arc/MetJ-type ribon-helix-helix transcriptional regulator